MVAIEPSMTPRQIELARHALGLPNDNKKSYRNRYYAPAVGESAEQWFALILDGMAACHQTEEGGNMFWLTEAGAEAALIDGENLSAEDFPNSVKARYGALDIERAIRNALSEEFYRHTGAMTYVVRNCLPSPLRKKLSTAQVLYRLKKMEAAGKVERVPSNYAVMICWRIKE